MLCQYVLLWPGKAGACWWTRHARERGRARALARLLSASALPLMYDRISWKTSAGLTALRCSGAAGDTCRSRARVELRGRETSVTKRGLTLSRYGKSPRGRQPGLSPAVRGTSLVMRGHMEVVKCVYVTSRPTRARPASPPSPPAAAASAAAAPGPASAPALPCAPSCSSTTASATSCNTATRREATGSTRQACSCGLRGCSGEKEPAHSPPRPQPRRPPPRPRCLRSEQRPWRSRPDRSPLGRPAAADHAWRMQTSLTNTPSAHTTKP
jgi:hypothetical protein